MFYHYQWEYDHKAYFRAWLHYGRSSSSSIELLLLEYSTPALSIGRGSRSVKFHVCIPYLFSLWIKRGATYPQ